VIPKLVIVGLVVVWAIVLLPDVMQRFSRGRRTDPMRSFNSQLTSLGRRNDAPAANNVIDLRARTSPALADRSSDRSPARPARAARSADRSASTRSAPVRSAAPRSHTPSHPRTISPAVRKRRQDVLVSLGSVAVLTLLATVAFGGPFLYVHLLSDVLLAGYLVLLARAGATQSAPAAARSSRRDALAPFGPLDAFGTHSVGSPQPAEARRIAN